MTEHTPITDPAEWLALAMYPGVIDGLTEHHRKMMSLAQREILRSRSEWSDLQERVEKARDELTALLVATNQAHEARSERLKAKISGVDLVLDYLRSYNSNPHHEHIHLAPVQPPVEHSTLDDMFGPKTPIPEAGICCREQVTILRSRVEVWSLAVPPRQVERYSIVSKWQCVVVEDHNGYDWHPYADPEET